MDTITLPTRQITVVDYHDFNKTVAAVFDGRPYDVLCAIASPVNGNLHAVYVSFAENEQGRKFAQDKFDQWMALPLPAESGSTYNPERSAFLSHSPHPEVMAMKMREMGMQVPEEFHLDIWW